MYVQICTFLTSNTNTRQDAEYILITRQSQATAIFGSRDAAGGILKPRQDAEYIATHSQDASESRF